MADMQPLTVIRRGLVKTHHVGTRLVHGAKGGSYGLQCLRQRPSFGVRQVQDACHVARRSHVHLEEVTWCEWHVRDDMLIRRHDSRGVRALESHDLAEDTRAMGAVIGVGVPERLHPRYWNLRQPTDALVRMCAGARSISATQLRNRNVADVSA